MEGPRYGQRRGFATALLALAAVCTAGYALALHFRQDVAFGRGSFAYWVLVARHQEIRQFPALGAQVPPRYEYDAADGNAPARITATFPASAPPAEVRKSYAEICRAENFPATLGEDAVRCQATKWDIAIQTSAAGPGSAVVITWEER